MSILSKLSDLATANSPLTITPLEYQDLCNEVLSMPFESRAQYDDLILNFTYNSKEVIVKELEESV